MVEACAECGHAFFAGEWKYCERCFSYFQKMVKELREEIKEYKREINDLEEEISKLEKELTEYKEIVMSEPKLWSKLIAKRMKS